MMPLHQERLGVKVFLEVMLLFHTLAHDALNHLLHSRPLAAVDNVTLGRNHGGTWCSGITPAQHAGGPWVQSPACPSLILSGSAPWPERHKKESGNLRTQFSLSDYLECLL